MKTTIVIQGQIGGNSTLCSAIAGISSANPLEVNRTMFNGREIIFSTRKEAKKALWEAYKYLRAEQPKDWNLSYCAGESLNYDASTARIVKEF